MSARLSHFAGLRFFPTQRFTLSPLPRHHPLPAGGRPRRVGRLLSRGSSWLPGARPRLGMSGVPRTEGRKPWAVLGWWGRNLAALLAWVRWTSWFRPGAQQEGLAPPVLCPGLSEGLCTGCFLWLHTPLPLFSRTSFRSPLCSCPPLSPFTLLYVSP